MRIKLEKYLDKKIEVQATYKNYAITNNRRHDLFLNVCLDDEEISNHIWIKLKKSQQKKLKKKIRYTIEGTVKIYYKNSKDSDEKIMDYCLQDVEIKFQEEKK